MKAVTISKLRKNISKYFHSVRDSNEIIVVPGSKDDDAVVILSLNEYNAITETNHLLSTEANRTALKKSMKQAESMDVVEFDPTA